MSRFWKNPSQGAMALIYSATLNLMILQKKKNEYASNFNLIFFVHNLLVSEEIWSVFIGLILPELVLYFFNQT